MISVALWAVTNWIVSRSDGFTAPSWSVTECVFCAVHVLSGASVQHKVCHARKEVCKTVRNKRNERKKSTQQT